MRVLFIAKRDQGSLGGVWRMEKKFTAYQRGSKDTFDREWKEKLYRLRVGVSQ